MKKGNLIYGIRAIIEAIEAAKPINKIYLQRGLSGDLFKELEQHIRRKGLSSSYVPVDKLNKLTTNKHQGAIASISPVAFQDFEATAEKILTSTEKPLFLILDGITDVRNFGAIIRTAECTGVHLIIVSKNGAAPINDDTIKTSAGAAFNIPIAKVDHIKDALFYLQASEVKIVAATEKAPMDIYQVDLTNPLAIIMGSEDRGINPSVLNLVSEKTKLPLLGSIASLNVSVACGVFLYEVVRQRMG
ncbi:RNA methyltransferase, TrmH family, group 3 [Croceitalea dokdonensis DOKDO 023]|uniref:RNA methyltransferase, TrmH family, group 3 n=1 Tax=Croceitalea dokdonensis DOKDO 023 TaxID=1300341 RepID=A0A0P7AWL2_9FLAO|nr:23S rRNA (guanosine(2251)-2'-O)-methyltransferase RlmB [Croceitalea dokdonensis]KPM32486.1 RNA methyltransferase, TrmH family, group 3 [Croceitalea dokdonensis DOKDO 023]